MHIHISATRKPHDRRTYVTQNNGDHTTEEHMAHRSYVKVKPTAIGSNEDGTKKQREHYDNGGGGDVKDGRRKTHQSNDKVRNPQERGDRK